MDSNDLVQQALDDAANRLAEGVTDWVRSRFSQQPTPANRSIQPAGRNHTLKYANDETPVKFHSGVDDQDVNNASRQAFTALDYALDHGHHPKLWAAVKGTPFATQYTQEVCKGKNPDTLHV